MQPYKFRNQIKYLSLLFLLLASIALCAQEEDRMEEIGVKLDIATQMGEPIDELVTISLNGKIQELAGFLAETVELNISVDPKITKTASITFTDAKVRDVILYLCDAYDLDLRLTGSILQLIPYNAPPKPIKLKEPYVKYRRGTGTIDLDLRQDTLEKVVRKISEETGQNIVVSPLIRNTRVSGYINDVKVDKAIRQLAENNDFELEERDGYFYLGQFEDENEAKNANKRAPGVQVENLYVKRIGNDQVTVKAINVPVLDVIKEVAIQLDEDYYLMPEVQSSAGTNNLRRSSNQGNRNSNNQQRPIGQESRNSNSRGTNSRGQLPGENLISLQMKNASFQDVLEYVSKNSDYTYELRSGVYMIGQRTAEGLRMTRFFSLKHRSAKGVAEFIPEDMTTGVQIDTLFELNSLILSGSRENIEEITDFLMKIDRLVPVVMIELIIIDVQTNMMREVGVEAGISEGGRPTGGSLVSGENPGGLNFNFSPDAINNVLDLLAGANIINLGQVSNNFYLNLQAVEETGLIDIQSTPKLSTLNSHAANLSIGETRYYQEQENVLQGTVQPVTTQSIRFQEVQANLDIEILPMVSGDEQVTLEIYFNQSEFIAAPSNAPPPQVSRSFESMIRMKNGEMIVLGGLERESKADVRRGLPFLSRIPIIGWLFGKKSKTASKNKLLIFVKPTIIN